MPLRGSNHLDRTMSFDPATYDPFARICQAAIGWAEGRNESKLPQTHQPAALTFTALNRRYHGLNIGNESAVLIEESDGSHWLLRAEDGRASQQFSWGYPGGGPRALAMGLINDSMVGALPCPDCLGAAPAAGGLVVCAGCGNTGHRTDTYEFVSLIVDRVIQHLPNLPAVKPTWPDDEWTVSHQLLIESLTAQ